MSEGITAMEEEVKDKTPNFVSGTAELEPDMSLAQLVFRYGRLLSNDDDVIADGIDVEQMKENYEKKLSAEIERKQMAPLYEWICMKFGWDIDKKKLEEMKLSNDAEAAYLEAKLDEARRNSGDMEVVDAMFDIARFYGRICDKEKTYLANDEIRDRAKVSSGKKVDAVMNKIRISLFYLDLVKAKEQLAQAKKLAETGGDWDRNNRLAVYEAIFFLVNRDFKEAAKKLLSGVSTFTCTELCDYQDFVFYAVISNLLALTRPELKKKILDAPDVLQILPQIPHLQPLVSSLYDCEYATFFRHLLPIDARVKNDRYLQPHSKFLLRELRILVYTQFLDAYKSVTLQAMADKFQVSLSFLDKELAHFVAQHRLNANIDSVHQIVHTNRPDANSAHYQSIIKQGDLLLNQIQKLARCVAI